MRCMSRNKQTVYYALYVSSADILDDYGNITGQASNTYSTPVEIRVNVSPSRGTSDVELFGINTNYTKTIVTDDMSCPIDEKSILWIGRETTQPYNYVVKQVAKSINSITYAIEEVNVANV